MTIKARDSGGTSRTITAIRLRDSGGTLRTVSRVRARDKDNVLHTLWETGGTTPVDEPVALDTYALFASASGAAASGSVGPATITITANYGTPPHRFYSERLSGSTGITSSGSSPNDPTRDFTATVTDGSNKVATYRFRAVDDDDAVEYSDPFTVELEWIDTR